MAFLGVCVLSQSVEFCLVLLGTSHPDLVYAFQIAAALANHYIGVTPAVSVYYCRFPGLVPGREVCLS